MEPELRVAVDVGSRLQHVAVGSADGTLLNEFRIDHGRTVVARSLHPCLSTTPSGCAATPWGTHQITPSPGVSAHIPVTMFRNVLILRHIHTWHAD